MKSKQQRLNNIIGQLEGIKKMLDSQADCLQILTQLKAAKSALSNLTTTIVEEQFDSCFPKLKKSDKKLLINLKKYVTTS